MSYNDQERQELHKASMAKDNYLVAVKLLLRDGDQLLITHDIFSGWDIPGGRIRSDQFETPLEAVLSDKIEVELGADVRYQLGGIKETFRVEREELRQTVEKVRIFAVGYEATYLGGDIHLGKNHDKYEWIDLRSVNLKDYAAPGGWVEQLAEYQQSIL